MLILSNFRIARSILFTSCKEDCTGVCARLSRWYSTQLSGKATYVTSTLPQQQTALRKDKNQSRLNYCCISASFLTTSCTHGGKHQIQYKPYVFPPKMDHDHKNMKLKRPMSPHVTIYAPTIPSVTSIMQRITGSILTAYALMMSFGTLFLSNGVETYVCIIQSMNLGTMTIFILKLLVGFPFTFHYFNGMRYAAFNNKKLLDLKGLYSSAKQAIVGGIALDVLFAFL
ncbi:unnamed protein product [Arctia plantaginis]|uniref:Succinate dehydrogenase cytochrome b560 subunit, mitochondrial n=1 Tax=Arctia plantaginis TaxID=874455 RepID=A0A8S1BKC3_ARCPL|nr:unnamed protein product [Arctia plantaginis]